MSTLGAVYALGNMRKAMFLTSTELILRPHFGAVKRFPIGSIITVKKTHTLEFDAYVNAIELELRSGESIVLSGVKNPEQVVDEIEERLRASRPPTLCQT